MIYSFCYRVIWYCFLCLSCKFSCLINSKTMYCHNMMLYNKGIHKPVLWTTIKCHANLQQVYEVVAWYQWIGEAEDYPRSKFFSALRRSKLFILQLKQTPSLTSLDSDGRYFFKISDATLSPANLLPHINIKWQLPGIHWLLLASPYNIT